MTVHSDCEHSSDACAWVLRALDDAGARRFATHLEGCERCRREVAELQVVVDSLPISAPQLPPPAALKDRIMAVVRSEGQLLRSAGAGAGEPAPRRRAARNWLGPVLRLRPVPAVALACLLLAAGIVSGLALRDGGPGAVRTIPVPAAGGIQAQLLIADGGRAELAVTGMPAPPAGRVYQVWLKRDGRAPEPTHTLFNVRRDGRATVRIDESLGDADQVLVTAEPDGGSAAPSTSPVITADV